MAPNRVVGSKRCAGSTRPGGWLQAPPGGSMLSRAQISGATPFDSKLNASPRASPFGSENALDGASAAYRFRFSRAGVFGRRRLEPAG
jgi:hypothetical protein